MTDHSQESLKKRYIDLHGFWNKSLDIGLTADSAFFADYLTMADAVLGAGHIDAKTRDFVQIAVNAAATHLNAEAVQAHIGSALKNGASSRELLEVFQVASVTGIHGYMSAVPILLEELGRDDPAAVDRAFPKDERFEAAKKILHESAWLLE